MPEADPTVEKSGGRDLRGAFLTADLASQPVLALLTRLAVRRHGRGAVVSALSRAERAPRTTSAF
jgi:hypothetical protein